MKRQCLDCDLCGKQDVHGTTIDLAVDRKTDAAGSPDTVYETLDICPGCLPAVVTRLIDALRGGNRFNYEANQAIVATIRGKALQKRG